MASQPLPIIPNRVKPRQYGWKSFLTHRAFRRVVQLAFAAFILFYACCNDNYRAGITSLPVEHVAADKTITGKTTFQELIDGGVSEEAIRQIIGGDLPALSTVIKGYVTQKGREFALIKTALQAEVDKTK